MTQVDYVTIGEITLDDTVLPEGSLFQAQSGGGSIYSAIGLRIWGGRVGVNSVVGQEYPEGAFRFLEEQGIDMGGVSRRDGYGLRLWLLHEEENIKQQVPKKQSATFAQLDEARQPPPASYWQARGVHLAPATPEGQMRARELAREQAPSAIRSLDILVEPFIDADYYRNGEALIGIDVFTPSIVEVQAIWGNEPPRAIFERWAAWGIRWGAIKMDSRGALVADLVQHRYFHIPIYRSAAVDPTGAGDAFSGGFLAGICTSNDVVEAGVQGTVSASYAIEHYGAFDILKRPFAKRDERASEVRARVRPVDGENFPAG